MSANHRYFPEHLVSKAEIYLGLNQQISIELGGEHFQLKTPEELRLAAALVSSYHNQYACLVEASEYEGMEWVAEASEASVAE
jgi:hypothetical protein